MKNKYFLPILFFTCIALLFSCTAEKHLAKAVKKDKPYVAEQTRLMFPCIETSSDTINTVDTVYDLIEAKCPDVEYTTPEGKTVVLPGRTTVVKGATVYIDRFITKSVKDSAEIYLIQNNMEVAAAMHKEDTLKLRSQITTITKEVKDVKQGRNRWRKWCLWTWGAMGLVVLFKIFRSKIGL